jgi:hypothetical protein
VLIANDLDFLKIGRFLSVITRKFRQALVENVSTVLCLSWESRTTIVCPLLATSTHSPETEAVLFRHRKSAYRSSIAIKPLSGLQRRAPMPRLIRADSGTPSASTPERSHQLDTQNLRCDWWYQRDSRCRLVLLLRVLSPGV